MEYSSVIFAVVSALVAVAVAYGIIRSEVSTMKLSYHEHQAEIVEIRKEISKEMVSREHCKDTHNRTEKDFNELKGDIKEIKGDVKEINRLVTDMAMRSKP